PGHLKDYFEVGLESLRDIMAVWGQCCFILPNRAFSWLFGPDSLLFVKERRLSGSFRSVVGLLQSRCAFGIGAPLSASRRHLGCGCSSVVEHDLAKVGVEGSSPFARSRFSKTHP